MGLLFSIPPYLIKGEKKLPEIAFPGACKI
jgi:hypothetical protein